MELQEKKYLVKSFAPVQRLLTQKGAPKVREVVSTHYYGQHEGNDVKKFVEYVDRYEIHIFKEDNGKFTMTHHAKIPSKVAGIAWLKKRGFTKANVVKMDYVEYGYKNGLIGLYTIDDFLKSVILSFPPGEHETVEKEFGLLNAKVITVPYNKQLEEMGRLRSITLG